MLRATLQVKGGFRGVFIIIEFRWKGRGGGAHPLHPPSGSSPVGRSVASCMLDDLAS